LFIASLRLLQQRNEIIKGFHQSVNPFGEFFYFLQRALLTAENLSKQPPPSHRSVACCSGEANTNAFRAGMASLFLTGFIDHLLATRERQRSGMHLMPNDSARLALLKVKRDRD